MKDDESSIRSDTRDLPGYPPDMSGPTGYTGDSLASDLSNRSAAGTDWECDPVLD